ncbi:chrysanthemyl diphosphate synthase [Artemisia annua]|uniref:Chrysanthemyl diphosphate synthase n=1 Tax=Artemisia annua TaxID=35608 RepID=A0A2U1QMY9_ARTAN|nr:chrysanthemyl diphosphate synthase [Artemisia annua]
MNIESNDGDLNLDRRSQPAAKDDFVLIATSNTKKPAKHASLLHRAVIMKKGLSSMAKAVVGVVAINDGVLLRNHVHRILKKHFQGKAYYVHIVDLFNETEFQTISGQRIDTIARLAGQKDLSKYSMSLNRKIVQYKGSYYTCYLPVDSGLGGGSDGDGEGCEVICCRHKLGTKGGKGWSGLTV